MPDVMPHATCIHICAILGPTPGNLSKASTVLGISPLNCSFRIFAVSLMCFTFV